MLAGPIFNATFPRFTSLVTIHDEDALKLLYHQSSQLMAVIVLPVAVVLSFFSYDILLVWTGNANTAGVAAPIVSVLVIGMALNALMTMPYTLQLSHGWTSIGLFITFFLIITFVPVIYIMTTHYGAVGAAGAWVILNIIYMLIGVPLTHRRLLKREMKRWFIEDMISPAVAVLLVVGVGRLLITSPMTTMTTIFMVSIVLILALLTAALVTSHMREWLLLRLKTRIANA
jgi:O-antigen/teichoic acid export membrane protein